MFHLPLAKNFLCETLEPQGPPRTLATSSKERLKVQIPGSKSMALGTSKPPLRLRLILKLSNGLLLDLTRPGRPGHPGRPGRPARTRGGAREPTRLIATEIAKMAMKIDA